MTQIERKIYDSWLSYALNQLTFPLRQLVPQPVIASIPGLKTNKQVRTQVVLSEVRGRLLDIGCGNNQLVRAYSGPGTGVDVHPWPGIDLLVEDTAHLPFPEASFDTITFVACLNHIPNREDVLQEARRLLTPGGRVVITNLPPTLSRLWHWWAFWDPDQHERGMGKGEEWGFTKDELCALLVKAGFDVALQAPFNWGLLDLFVAEVAKTA
ncbi:MAG: methyltransferase domain-containing protein [Alphaproteobacteria bacterium]|nr:methyltransferase domain-containing protein [Alphaproteobacteria bacterium]